MVNDLTLCHVKYALHGISNKVNLFKCPTLGVKFCLSPPCYTYPCTGEVGLNIDRCITKTIDYIYLIYNYIVRRSGFVSIADAIPTMYVSRKDVTVLESQVRTYIDHDNRSRGCVSALYHL